MEKLSQLADEVHKRWVSLELKWPSSISVSETNQVKDLDDLNVAQRVPVFEYYLYRIQNLFLLCARDGMVWRGGLHKRRNQVSWAALFKEYQKLDVCFSLASVDVLSSLFRFVNFMFDLFEVASVSVRPDRFNFFFE